MTSPLASLSARDVAARLGSGSARLFDIREVDEFAREHIAGAESMPLSGSTGQAVTLSSGQSAIFMCRSGNRTQINCDRLAAQVTDQAYVLEGGLEAWKAAGLPTLLDRGQPLELMRQVQIAAGGLILLGAILGTWIHPAFWGLSAFVGAGLMFAGLTGFCGMARLLAMAPWNRRSNA